MMTVLRSDAVEADERALPSGLDGPGPHGPAQPRGRPPARGRRWRRLAGRLSSVLGAPAPPAPSPAAPPVDVVAPPLGGPQMRPSPRRGVTVRLLGSFELAIDGSPVTEWRGQRGPAVLKLVLSQAKHQSPRDVIIDTLWPEADPERVRNRLQVAVSSVRRSVRLLAPVEIIEHHESSYRVPPDLELWVDVEEFERLVDAGRRAESAGRAEEAVDAYERAAALYRGDFLADDLYEEWTSLPREMLRVAYLDLLDRLAQLHIDARRTSACVEVAQLILAQDQTREDAHRLLMRCYAEQGRVRQVDRQFELCRRTLADALGSSPSRATVELYRDLRVRACGARDRDWSFA